MAWSGGTFSRVRNWQADKANSIGIEAAKHDEEDDNLAAGINQAINKDGSNAFTGDVNAGSNKLLAVAKGANRTDGVNVEQVQDGEFTYAVDTGAANVYAIALSPAPAAYAAGQIYWVKITNANTAASTLNVNSLGAVAIKKPDGEDVASGDLPAGAVLPFAHDGTVFRLSGGVASLVVKEETQTATAGQTVFNLTTMTYTPGTANLAVYVNGVRQYSTAYTETSASRVTFTSGLTVGDVVLFEANRATTITTMNASAVTYDPSGTGAVSRSVESALRETVSVKDFGAVGDGVTDDTAAIQAAWDFCLSTSNGSFPAESGELAAFIVNGPSLYFPAGDYVYNGTGLDSTTNTAFRLHGEGSSNTRIKITAGSYLIDLDNRYLNHMTIQDIHFEGGAGVFRNSYTSNNVAGQYVVKDCFFSNYTDCAVGHNSVDMPRWYFENNMFNGTTTSIGIALQGLANGSVITRNFFGTNLYGIKLGYGGPDVKIAFNEFIHRAAGGGSPDFVNIWVVPKAATAGFKGPAIFSNKFGSENLSAGDYRILFADEGITVTDFLDTPHSVSASAGYIEAVTTYDNQFGGNSGYTRPYIVSYTPNVRHCKWGQDFFIGTYSSGGWVSFPAASLTEDRNRQSIIEIGPSQDGMNKLGPRLFPDGNMGYVSDPLGYHAGEHDVPNHFTAGGASSDFTNLLSSNNLVTDGGVTNATRAGITDSMGGTNAIELTLTAASGRVYLNGIAANVVANQHAWIELDLLKSTTTPLSDIYFDIYRDSVKIAIRRFVLLPDEWKTIRIPWVPTQTYSTNLQIRIIGSGYSAGVATNFKVGRPRIYHSSEPVNFGRLSGGVSQTTVGAAGSASALPATPEGYQTIVVDGTEYVMPYYAKS